MAMYFVQHGLAVAKDIDPDRPLSESGQKELKRISIYLKNLGIKVGLIYHSGKKRAMQTAQIFSDHISHGSIDILSGMNPKDDVKVFAQNLKENNVMYVGHLPHLQKVVSYLITQNEDAKIIKFVNGGVVCIEKEDSRFYIEWYLKPSTCIEFN